MKIGIVSWESLHSIAAGGVAAHVTALARALVRGGDEVHLVTRIAPGQGTYERIDDVHYHRCSFRPCPDFIGEINSMCGAFTARLLEVEDFCGPFDVIHGHDWLTVKACTWARQARRRPVVTTFHSTEYGRCGNNMWEGASRRIRDYEWEGQYESEAVIAVSNGLRDEVMRLYATPAEKIRTVYNGVDVRQFDGWVDQGRVKERYAVGPVDPMVLFVGRMVYQKGPDLLLEAVPRTLADCPKARFVFVGDGDMRWHLQEKARWLGVDHAVRFLGHRDGRELLDIYRAAEVVSVPSRNEPFGIVILEAWSAGKPVVATMSGGPAEFVWHGVTGLKTATNPDSISRSLLNLLTNYDYGRWMGRNGRLAAETTFSWDRIAGRVREIYRQASGK
jgi:glycogen synthase